MGRGAASSSTQSTVQCLFLGVGHLNNQTETFTTYLMKDNLHYLKATRKSG